jgi:hypothetical protein
MSSKETLLLSAELLEQIPANKWSITLPAQHTKWTLIEDSILKEAINPTTQS